MRNTLQRGVRILAALGLATFSAPTLLVSGAAMLGTPTPAMAQDASKDSVVFRDGKVVQGTILEETPTTVRMKVTVAGISSEATYQKSEILSIVKASAPATPATPDTTAKPGVAGGKPPTKTAAPEPTSDKKKVYVIECTGTFGEDISETPIRNAMADAKKLGADVVIVKMDNDWSLKRRGQTRELKDDNGAFDQLFRAEKMEPIFTEEITRWDKPPQVVFWVKKAMGGAAFLPFICPTIYFHSEGKMGGIGHLQAIFGTTGDQVVREKQFSLRLGHAKGKAIQGGYDPRIVEAMARDEYVLSVRFEGGKPVLLERMPESADEILLTDDGKDANADDEEALARGEGNDCLTLNADLAYKLGISKGTADTLDDLIYQLGLSRTSDVLKSQSANIMKAWRDGLEEARHQLPKLATEFKEVKVKDPGGYQQRTEARGRRKSLASQMQAIEKKYEEALNPQMIGVPDWNQLEDIKKQLELQQLADKPEKKR